MVIFLEGLSFCPFFIKKSILRIHFSPYDFISETIRTTSGFYISFHLGLLKKRLLNQGLLKKGLLNKGLLKKGLLNQGLLKKGLLNKGLLNKGLLNQGTT